MSGTVRKPSTTMKDSVGKVKRSELEDSTKRSLDREGNRLNNTLKQYDKARKVIKKGLESDERQTAKFTRQMQSLNFGQILPIFSDSRYSGSPDSSPLSTPRREKTFYERSGRGGPTQRGAKRIGSVHGENRHPVEEDYLDASCNAPKPPRRELSRTQLFNSLSKPKNRSDVMSIRNRLRQEFDSPKPRMDKGFLGRSTTCPDMWTLYGKSYSYSSAYDVIPRGRPVRQPEDILANKSPRRAAKELSSVMCANGKPLTEEDINALLVPPKPVIVKRKERSDSPT